MIGVRGCLVILQVTGRAGRTGEIEVSIRVALVALKPRVSAGQGEPHRVVIEVCRLPGSGCVALLAVLRKSERYVIRIASLLVIR